MLPSRVSTRARPSPFHRCPTRPSGKGSTRRAARCPASFRVLSRPGDTTSSALKRQRPDAGFAKEKSPVLVGQNRAQSCQTATEDKAPWRKGRRAASLRRGCLATRHRYVFRNAPASSFGRRPAEAPGAVGSEDAGLQKADRTQGHLGRAEAACRNRVPREIG